jgi:hypothetical protein
MSPFSPVNSEKLRGYTEERLNNPRSLKHKGRYNAEIQLQQDIYDIYRGMRISLFLEPRMYPTGQSVRANILEEKSVELVLEVYLH